MFYIATIYSGQTTRKMVSMSSIVDKYAPFLSSSSHAMVAVAIFLVTIFLIWAYTTSKTKQTTGGRRALADEEGDHFGDSDPDGDTDDDPHPTSGQEEEEPKHIPYRAVTYSEQVMIQRSREFYELMNQRRTVRFFSDKPVPTEVIDNLIRTAGMRYIY